MKGKVLEMANLETVVSDFLDKRDNLITTAERLEELIGDVSESKTLEKRVTAFLDEFFDFMVVEKDYVLSLNDACDALMDELGIPPLEPEA